MNKFDCEANLKRALFATKLRNILEPVVSIKEQHPSH